MTLEEFWDTIITQKPQLGGNFRKNAIFQNVTLVNHSSYTRYNILIIQFIFTRFPYNYLYYPIPSEFHNIAGIFGKLLSMALINIILIFLKLHNW